MKKARNNEKRDDQKDESLKSRRSFLKKVAIGTAFAVPTIQSFSKSDILLKSALAQSGPIGPTYTITSSLIDTNGTITPLGAVTVLQGASQSFVMQANAGWKLEELTEDGMHSHFMGIVTNYTSTFTNVQANHTISIHFLLI